MNRVRRLKREEVRRRIIESAMKIFSEQGFQAASVEAIAEHAGFSKGAVYSNFPGKDELFFELIDMRITERLERISKTISGVNAAKDRATMAGDSLLSIIAEDPQWQILFVDFWLMCARNENLQERFRKTRSAMHSRITTLIETEAEASGMELPLPPSSITVILLSLSNGLGIERILDPTSVPSDLFGNVLRHLVPASDSDEKD